MKFSTLITIILVAVSSSVLTILHVKHQEKAEQQERVRVLLEQTENCNNAPTPFACEW